MAPSSCLSLFYYHFPLNVFEYFFCSSQPSFFCVISFTFTRLSFCFFIEMQWMAIFMVNQLVIRIAYLLSYYAGFYDSTRHTKSHKFNETIGLLLSTCIHDYSAIHRNRRNSEANNNSNTLWMACTKLAITINSFSLPMNRMKEDEWLSCLNKFNSAKSSIGYNRKIKQMQAR